MKQTHTIQDIEGLMFEIVIKIRDAETKAEKQALLKRLKNLEQHYNSCNEKHLNGKKYPKKVVPKDIPKKELLALIDSVEIRQPNDKAYDNTIRRVEVNKNRRLDLSGVFIK